MGSSSVLEILTVEPYCGFAQAPLVVTQKLPVSTLPKVESRHNLPRITNPVSDLTGDQ